MKMNDGTEWLSIPLPLVVSLLGHMQPAPAADFRGQILAHGQYLKNAVDKLKHVPDRWYTTLLIQPGPGKSC